MLLHNFWDSVKNNIAPCLSYATLLFVSLSDCFLCLSSLFVCPSICFSLRISVIITFSISCWGVKTRLLSFLCGLLLQYFSSLTYSPCPYLFSNHLPENHHLSFSRHYYYSAYLPHYHFWSTWWLQEIVVKAHSLMRISIFHQGNIDKSLSLSLSLSLSPLSSVSTPLSLSLSLSSMTHQRHTEISRANPESGYLA